MGGGGAPSLSQVWSSVAREYHRHIVPGFRPAAQRLCEFAGIRPGDQVLDVACGPGTASFIAKDLGSSQVLGIDFAPGMIELAQELARGLEGIAFRVGDATDLPVEDGAFDVVVSSFGLVFAPDPHQAVREAARVLKPGGRIALLEWPSTGTLAEYYNVVYRYITMPPSQHEPHEWGDPDKALTWLDAAFEQLVMQPLDVPYEATSAEEAWRVFQSSTGRVTRGYQQLDSESRRSLDVVMTAYFQRFERPDGSIYWPREALMVKGVVKK